jgi:hypothetical protein
MQFSMDMTNITQSGAYVDIRNVFNSTATEYKGIWLAMFSEGTQYTGSAVSAQWSNKGPVLAVSRP